MSTKVLGGKINLCAQELNAGPMAALDSDQTAQMHWLIRVFAGNTSATTSPYQEGNIPGFKDSEGHFTILRLRSGLLTLCNYTCNKKDNLPMYSWPHFITTPVITIYDYQQEPVWD